MPTKQLDRLMFAQGGFCFFCKQSLPKPEASVEHLYAKANGGDNNDENCVACCKAVNALLGSMSLKEKIQVVLNQKGQFKCPNGVGKSTSKNQHVSDIVDSTKVDIDKFNLLVTNLKRRGNSKPGTFGKLMAAAASIFPKDLPEDELKALLDQLQASGKITVVDNNKVTYNL